MITYSHHDTRQRHQYHEKKRIGHHVSLCNTLFGRNYTNSESSRYSAWNYYYVMICAFLLLIVIYCVQFIDLNHQRLHFTRVNKTIAWDDYSTQNNITDCHHFKVESISITSSCPSVSVTVVTVNTWVTNVTEMTVSTNDLIQDELLLHFNITALNSRGNICQAVSMMFQVDPNGMFIVILIIFAINHPSMCKGKYDCMLS